MPAIDVVFDISVVVKWFHDTDELEVDEARRLLNAHQDGSVVGSTLDLAKYELGNVLTRRGVPAGDVATLVELLQDVLPLVPPTPDELRAAAELAAEHGLTYYDAAYAAVAGSRPSSLLITADRALQHAGLGLSATEACARLGLTAGG